MEKPKRGRRRLNRVKMSITVTQEQRDTVIQIADERDKDLSDICRDALRIGLEKMQEQRSQQS